MWQYTATASRFTESPESETEYMTGAQVEALAAADPGHDWQIVLQAPLSDRVYQRHGPEQWALVE